MTQITVVENPAVIIKATQQGETGAPGTVRYGTYAELSVALAHIADTIGFVTDDPDTTKNGEYVKSGVSGSGSWSQISRFLTLSSPVGAWGTSTAYVLRDLVTESGVVYICVEAHTSGTFATDLAAGKWAVYQGLTQDDVTDDPEAGKLPTWDGLTRLGYTDLQAIPFDDIPDGWTVNLAYRDTLGDGGGGQVYKDSAPYDSASLDPLFGVHVPPASDTSGASGTWVRQYDFLTPEMFGAVGDAVGTPGSSPTGTDCTAAIKGMFAFDAAAYVFKGGARYLIAPAHATWSDTSPPSASFMAQFATDNIVIVGNGAEIVDDTDYTSGGISSAFIGFTGDGLTSTNLNYSGRKKGSSNHLSGAIFCLASGGAKNINIKAKFSGMRYGLWNGFYQNAANSGVKNIHANLYADDVAYPLAAWSCETIRGNVYADYCRRVGFYSGCKGVEVSHQVKDFQASLAVLLGDEPDGSGNGYGCEDVKVKVRDIGSTAHLATGTYLAGIVGQLVTSTDPIKYRNIHLDVDLVPEDGQAGKMGGVLVVTTSATDEDNYIIDGLKITGLVDKSAQSSADEARDLFIDTADSVVQNLDVSDFQVVLGSAGHAYGANEPIWLNLPGLSGINTINRLYTDALTMLVVTNATSTLRWIDCDMARVNTDAFKSVGAYNMDFVRCKMSDIFDQSIVGTKRFFDCDLNGSLVGTRINRTELALTGASVTWTGAIPAGAIFLGVVARISETITGATGLLIGVSGETDRYLNSNSTAAGSVFGPTNYAATVTAPQQVQAAVDIVVTAKTSDFTDGTLQAIVYYQLIGNLDA